jgi:serine/threonine-protein kinase
MLVAGKYKIESLLQEGNFAWVYRARDMTLPGRPVRAIKVFKTGAIDDLTLKMRFMREVRVTRELAQETPHIVQLFEESGEIPGVGLFYVMELLEGCSLDEFLVDGVPLEYDLTFDVLDQLCSALSIVHKRGVVHRDLKPDNIFLADVEGNPNFVKLIDFGIAKASDTFHRFLTQNIVGTPMYMSPEQCSGEGTIDSRSDIYALGMLLYRCLAGVLPFSLPEGASYRKRMIALIQAHIYETPRSMMMARPDLSVAPVLDRTILRALAKDPVDRYQTVDELWDALRPFVRVKSIM